MHNSVKNHRPLRWTLSLTLIGAAVLAGCSTVPANNAMLDQARSDYSAAQANPQARDLAAAELKQASDALQKANEAFARRDDTAAVDQLAYLAKQRVALAQQAASRKGAEMSVTEAGMARDKMRLAARTNEADAAQLSATNSQRDAQAAQRDAQASQQQAAASQRQADASQRQSSAAQMQASDAERRAQALEMQLRDLNAKKTERGMVVTIGDVLFDTDQAQLKAGGARSVEKLVSFLKEYPQRHALIEGFTDNTGGASHNQALSGRRADAVRSALVGMGVGADRLATRGYGDAYPVAGNDSSGGRQMNRRVEIVLSDDSGNIVAR